MAAATKRGRTARKSTNDVNARMCLTLARPRAFAAELGKSAEAADALKRLDPDWRVEAAFNLPLPSDRTVVMQSAAKAGLPVCMTAAEVEARKTAFPFEESQRERARAAAVN